MKTIRIASIFLLLLVAVNALAAGYLFITDPSGSKMHIPVNLLQHSPFNNFLVPGIVLFIVNGVLNLVAAACTILKTKGYAGLIVMQGILLTGWIIIQILMIQQVHFLHLLLGATGILLFMFGNRLNI